MKFTGRQLAAARTLAGITKEAFADLAELSRETIVKIESGQVDPRAATRAAILNALSKLGVVFTEDEGVRRKNDIFRVFEGKDSYLRILEDVFFTLKDTKGEVLFAYVRNELSTPEAIESDLRLRELGIRFRSLIEEGDTYCLYPRREYRTITKRHFKNNVQVIYGNKYAGMMSNDNRAFIIHDPGLTEMQRNTFEILWDIGRMPKTTTAPKTYE